MNNQNNYLNDSYRENDELELKDLLDILIRRKVVIAGLSCLGILFGGVYASFQQKVWKGDFQIVVSEKSSPRDNPLASLLTNASSNVGNVLPGFDTNSKSLKTEVEILRSPSILFPIYEYVKEERLKKSGGKEFKKYSFNAWRKKNLTITLKKNTQILNLEYRDNDKELIVNVLNKISKAYQQYSGRDRNKGIENGLNYLDKQIEIYKKKDLKSIKEAQSYAIENDLIAYKMINTTGDERTIDITIGIEAERVRATNKLREIDQLIKQINQSTNLNESFLPVELEKDEVIREIEDLDVKISRLRANYKANDPELKNKIQIRKSLTRTAQERTLNSLKQKRIEAQAAVSSYSRPKEVIFEYRRLLREAMRNQSALDNLEIERTLLSLEKSKKEDPWELITKPTLLNTPIAPVKTTSMFVGLCIGFMASFMGAFIFEKKKNLLYNLDKIDNLINWPLLDIFEGNLIDGWDESLNLIDTGVLASKPNGRISLLKLGELDQELLDKFISKFKTVMNKRELIVTRDIREALKTDYQILLTSKGAITPEDITRVSKRISSQDNSVVGWIMIIK